MPLTEATSDPLLRDMISAIPSHCNNYQTQFKTMFFFLFNNKLFVFFFQTIYISLDSFCFGLNASRLACLDSLGMTVDAHRRLQKCIYFTGVAINSNMFMNIDIGEGRGDLKRSVLVCRMNLYPTRGCGVGGTEKLFVIVLFVMVCACVTVCLNSFVFHNLNHVYVRCQTMLPIRAWRQSSIFPHNQPHQL